MNQKPVSIPKKVAEAIENLRSSKCKWTDEQIAQAVLADDGPRKYGDNQLYVDEVLTQDPHTIMRALYCGYAIQRSLNDAFEELATDYDLREGGDLAEGVAFALDIIGERDPKYAYLKKWADGHFKGPVAPKQEASSEPEIKQDNFRLSRYGVRGISVIHKTKGPITIVYVVDDVFADPMWERTFWENPVYTAQVRNAFKKLEDEGE